MFVIPHCDWSL